MLEEYEKVLRIPIYPVFSAGDDYHLQMENALLEMKRQGAEFACFGDIDIEENRRWSEKRCENTGLESVFPLWHSDREANVREIISLGYTEAGIVPCEFNGIAGVNLVCLEKKL